MKCYTILTYEDGEHGEPFYILVEDDYALCHALGIIEESPGVDFFEVDMQDGRKFYEAVHERLYHTSAPTAKEVEK